ncbi:uncharacterized protein LOC114271775 [Camellia sinensis]|uniref:uncharacterized protein LOC114271775 n=1 Tax=Camellia sinensis TaxID=4442 RepID=UPI00103628E2|nr:uncharacterized protein LOC114271775 [Camellia sinensis]
MTSSMIGGLISSDIHNKALTSVGEVVCDFKDYYGTEVSYRRAWMGVEKARGLIFGDYSSSFDDLRWYVDAANDCNPGSVLIWNLMLIVKEGKHKGYLLAVTAKDGNQGFYPLCFVNVDSESYDSWHWFLPKLFVILTLGRDVAFVTDRHGGLLKALAVVFLFSSHSFCLMHLKTNLKTYLLVKSRKSKEFLLTLFSRCAYVPTIELFNELFAEFKGCCGRCGRSVKKFLEDFPNECWYNAYFQGKRYGEMCTNAAESFNSWIRDEQKKLEEAFNDTKEWIVKKCSDDIYEIQLDHSLMVDIGKHSCSCRLWEIDSFPCKHGFYAIKMCGKDLNCFLDDYYRVSSYCDSYSHSICDNPHL